MKRGFMRAFWGVYDPSNRITARKKRVDGNIQKILKNPFNQPFITYVFGEDNYKQLMNMGFDCILLNKDPNPFNPIKYQYRHKLEALRYAMEEDGFDEMVHLDWDCEPQKKFSSDFWDILNKKESFQANLLLYHRRKALWRKHEQRKIPNGGFVYLRDKSYPGKIIKIWETMKSQSAEPAMAKFTDDLIGGWQGKEKYWELFEPEVVNPYNCSSFSKELLATKNVYFIHYQGAPNVP